MRYDNPPPVEGINYTKEHPLKEFVQLLIGVAIVISVVVFILNLSAGFLAKYIPFEYEKSMVSELELFEDEQKGDAAAVRSQLQALADKLAENMDLPPEIKITVHYSQSETINAFATLGGHLMFFEGLVQKLESEQELAAVMAHEIAHIQHRHPIVALGKGVTLATLIAVIGGASGSGTGEWLIGSSANLSLLQFSRSQESQADATAAAALNKTYGSIHGAKQLFERFTELENESIDISAGLEFFRSHPYSEKRWEKLKALALDRKWSINDELSE